MSPNFGHVILDEVAEFQDGEFLSTLGGEDSDTINDYADREKARAFGTHKPLLTELFRAIQLLQAYEISTLRHLLGKLLRAHLARSFFQ